MNSIELTDSEHLLVDHIIQKIEIETNCVISDEGDYRMLIEDLEYQKFQGHHISPARINNTIDRLDGKYHIFEPYKAYSEDMMKQLKDKDIEESEIER